MSNTVNKNIKAQAFFDLIARYKTIFSEAWSRRKELDSVPRLRHEYEFLPATLALQETPVHPAPQIFMRLILLFVVLLLVWSIFGKLDVVATAMGKIVPDSRSKIIQPMETASVLAIHVIDGQVVKAGDNLIELDATIAQADSDRLRAEFQSSALDVAMYKALLDAQENEMPVKSSRPKNASVKNTIELFPDEKNIPVGISLLELKSYQRLALGQFNAYQTRASQLAAVILRQEAEQRSTHAIVEKYQQTLPIIQQQEKDFQGLLTKKYVSQYEHLKIKKLLIEQLRDLEAETEKLAEISASRVEAERESKQFYAETRRIWLDKLSVAEQKSSSLSQELIKADSRGRFMRLTAPVDGTVQQLAVHTIGGVVTPAQPLMTIVPTNSPIEVEGFLSNQDIGFVHKGQQVEVKIETFSFTKYGTIKGEVIAVSSDAIKDEKLGLVFSVRVRLAKNTIWIDSKYVKLSPGMAVTVEIKTKQRRVIEYFLDPLMKHGAESLRER
ncbi:MAG: HlyD family type I secretion periplasmic adaptor subunit [Pseudomonadota bacterium]